MLLKSHLAVRDFSKGIPMNDTTTDGGTFARNYLAAARSELAAALAIIRHCLNQLNDAQVWRRPGEPMNSIGNLMLHLCGNLKWKFRAVIGGLPDDRDRPREFSERGPIPKEELLRRLEEVVAAADATLADLTPSQLLEIRKYRMLRGEAQSSVLAVVLQTLTHLSGHTQEIIYITRSQLGDAYQFRSPQAPPAPDAKTIAADDVVFSAGMLPAHAPESQTETKTWPGAGDGQKIDPPEDSPLKDYLLDLEQVFQDQNEEGKVEP
jgi:hypothetical protein